MKICKVGVGLYIAALVCLWFPHLLMFSAGLGLAALGITIYQAAKGRQTVSQFVHDQFERREDIALLIAAESNILLCAVRNAATIDPSAQSIALYTVLHSVLAAAAMHLLGHENI